MSCSLTKKEEKFIPQNNVVIETSHEYFEVENFYINWKDILVQNKDIYYVYIYSQTCSHCLDLKNWIIEKALERQDIFFMKGTNKDVIATDVSNTIGITSIENLAILGYPTMLKIQDKTLVKNEAGNSKIKDLLK